MAGPYFIFEPEDPESPVLVYEPAPGCYAVGRHPDQVDIVLPAEDVSRVHALVFVRDGQVLIQDANSSKGVVVDGQRIKPEMSVPVDSRNNILIGSFLLYTATELEEGVQAAAIKPGIHAQTDEETLRGLLGKIVDPTGKTLSEAEPPPGPVMLRDAQGRSTVEEMDSADVGATLQGAEPAAGGQQPGSEVEEVRYTFPQMPKVAPEDQDTVDRFIYRRVKPLFDQLMQERTGGGDASGSTEVRDIATELLTEILRQQAEHIPGGLSREEMLKLCCAAFLDYGPIQGLLGDPTVTEVMVNSPNEIFVEQNGKLFQSHLRFWDEHELRRVIEKMVMITNRRIDEQQPYQNTRLEDGSRVNVIIRPLALSGDSITIRKFPSKRLGIEDLLGYDSLDRKMATFLDLVVKYRSNIIVSGGTGSGKTTLLNVLSNFIPPDERLVSIEDAAELRLVQPNKVTLEARPASLEGGGAITIRDLVINALRMRPDRIVVGECRGGEAMDMLQAMNTGHDGSLTTLHANSPRDAIGRLETMCLMAGMDLPARAIRNQVVSAVDFIVQQSRLPGGLRKIVSVQEVVGLEGESVVMQEVFRFVRTGIAPDGKARGHFEPTGVVPEFVTNLREDKVDFPLELFAES
jgi:pilus assembly protein CpaF